MPRRVAVPTRGERVSVPGPWAFRAQATHQALDAFESRVADWVACGLQGDVLDDLVERHKAIVLDAMEKDVEALRGRMR